ncbi:MAG: hypothetical protein NTW38_06395 [Candidatus Aminicenantes bacterium]|nr:hypothetical protein [Candidatus Aminicenantes bacterium]
MSAWRDVYDSGIAGECQPIERVGSVTCQINGRLELVREEDPDFRGIFGLPAS